MFIPALVFVIQLTKLSVQVSIDNSVQGSPEVVCLADAAKMAISTEKPFRGHVYVKSQFGTPGCHTDFTNSPSSASNAVFSISYSGCQVRKERSLNPAGIYFHSTIVVQFHRMFLTKVDRAYTFSCFYMEATKTLTQGLEVSMLSTVDLTASMLMPVCTYTIHQGTLDGPIMHYAKVGENVFHRWRCESDTHGILVHSCYVRDSASSGHEFELIDERGCAVDPVALGDLSYSDDLTMSSTEVLVFRFADQMQITFQCQISLCVKADGGCDGITPPDCHSNLTGPEDPTASPTIAFEEQGKTPHSSAEPRPVLESSVVYASSTAGPPARTPFGRTKSTTSPTAAPSYSAPNDDKYSLSTQPITTQQSFEHETYSNPEQQLTTPSDDQYLDSTVAPPLQQPYATKISPAQEEQESGHETRTLRTTSTSLGRTPLRTLEMPAEAAPSTDVYEIDYEQLPGGGGVSESPLITTSYSSYTNGLQQPEPQQQQQPVVPSVISCCDGSSDQKYPVFKPVDSFIMPQYSFQYTGYKLFGQANTLTHAAPTVQTVQFSDDRQYSAAQLISKTPTQFQPQPPPLYTNPTPVVGRKRSLQLHPKQQPQQRLPRSLATTSDRENLATVDVATDDMFVFSLDEKLSRDWRDALADENDSSYGSRTHNSSLCSRADACVSSSLFIATTVVLSAVFLVTLVLSLLFQRRYFRLRCDQLHPYQ